MGKKFRFDRYLPWALLCFSILFSVILYARYGQNTLDADQSSEFVLADQLNREHALISRNWYYSTELRTVSPVIIYQLALSLFSSWHAARTFSVFILSVLCAAAFLYAAKKAGYGTEAVYCSACFILPFSKTQSFLFAWGCFYSMYFILGCILFGLIVSFQEAHHRILHLVTLTVLSIWAGTAGIRMFMIISIPMVLSCFFEWVHSFRNTKVQSMGDIKWHSIASAICLLSCCIGYLINIFLFSPIYSFRKYDTLFTGSFSIYDLLDRFDALLHYFGYAADVPVLSLHGGISFCLICLSFLVLIAPVSVLKKDGPAPRRRIVNTFAISAVLFVWLIDSMTSGYIAAPTSVGYYIMGLFFALFSVFVFIRQTFGTTKWQSLFSLLLVLVFYGNTISFIQRNVPLHEKQQSTAAAWLLKNGYTHGYATFWNGNLLTEYSNGAIDVILYDTWRSREPYEWLQSAAHLEALPEGPVFLYTDTEEMELDPSPCLSSGQLIYEENSVRIYLFQDAQTVHSTQLNQYL